MPDSAGDEWLDVRAIARILGVGRNTAYRLFARGKLHGSGGRPKRARRSELDDYIRRSPLTGAQLRHLYEWPRRLGERLATLLVEPDLELTLLVVEPGPRLSHPARR